MNLIKNVLHMNCLKSHRTTQLTLDDDFNVPDVKEDVYKIITKDATINSEGTKFNDGRLMFSGSLDFRFLYSGNNDGGRLYSMNGSIPFSETIALDDSLDYQDITVKWDVEDLNISIINTRKISVKAIVSISMSFEDVCDVETATAPDCENEDNVLFLTKSTDIAKLIVSTKDVYRIRESIDIPKDKPNISEILWDNVCLRSVSTKLIDGAVNISGDVSLFVLYSPESEELSTQWYTTTFPFSGNIDIPECQENMISDIDVNLQSSCLILKNDYDGEPRTIEPDIVVRLGIKIYDEETVNFIADAYSPDNEVTAAYNDIKYNSLVTKNVSMCKINDKLKLDSSKGSILQLLSSCGVIKIDEIEQMENSIAVDGVAILKIMYISSDDKSPIAIVDEVIPFTHNIEAPGITPDSLCFIRPSLEQHTATMTGSNEIEVKASVMLDCLVLNNNTEQIITDISTVPYSDEELYKRPGMVCYMTTATDTLWDIAKEFHTTIESIIETNELKSDVVDAGKMLLII